MKTSLNLLLWTTHVTEAALPHVRGLRDAGYAGVEVPIHQPDAAHHGVIGRAIRDFGMDITASTALPGLQADLLHTSPVIRRAAVDYLRHVVDSFGTALPDLAAATRCWRPTFTSENDVVSGGAAVFAVAWQSCATSI